ncbi:MAG: hypothetical protein LBS99_04715 [Clostridiales bacterium]|jgi:hypothetical protein|nr:hypothetical protein [Clostridiales bacterium]
MIDYGKAAYAKCAELEKRMSFLARGREGERNILFFEPRWEADGSGIYAECDFTGSKSEEIIILINIRFKTAGAGRTVLARCGSAEHERSYEAGGTELTVAVRGVAQSANGNGRVVIRSSEPYADNVGEAQILVIGRGIS